MKYIFITIILLTISSQGMAQNNRIEVFHIDSIIDRIKPFEYVSYKERLDKMNMDYVEYFESKGANSLIQLRFKKSYYKGIYVGRLVLAFIPKKGSTGLDKKDFLLCSFLLNLPYEPATNCPADKEVLDGLLHFYVKLKEIYGKPSSDAIEQNRIDNDTDLLVSSVKAMKLRAKVRWERYDSETKQSNLHVSLGVDWASECSRYVELYISP